ncbi:MAG: DUF4837 family protein [Flavobacteriaceae bacterium]
MLNRLSLLAFFATILAGCNRKQTPIIPTSNGNINAVTVVMPTSMWEGEVGQVVRDVYAYPAEGLPQEEPLFDLNQMPPEVFSGFARSGRNIIWIGLSNQIEVRLDENYYARPQTMAVFSAPETDALIESLISQATKVIDRFKAQDRKERLRRIQKATFDQHGLEAQFGLQMTMPSNYRVVKRGAQTLWLQRETQKGHINLLVYTTQYDPEMIASQNLNKAIAVRDSIGKAFVPGRLPNTHMITEAAYEPYTYTTQFTGKPALEVRGTWEVKGDFMAGPFLQYVIADKEKGYNLVMEGFVFAPSAAKRDYIFEVETILKSTREAETP